MNRALLIWVSLLAGAQVLAGAATMADIVGPKYAAFIVLAVGAMQIATVTYQHGLSTPVPTPGER